MRSTFSKCPETVLGKHAEKQEAKWEPYRLNWNKNGVWTVYGTLTRGSRGGTPMLKLRKRDRTVPEVWHSM
jgi:hypothetical protein